MQRKAKQVVKNPNNEKYIKDFFHFPFKVRFSLKYVIDYWSEKAPSLDSFGQKLFQSIETEIAAHSFLLEPMVAPEEVEEHEAFIKKLFSPIMPMDGWNNEYIAAGPPFSHTLTLIETENYKRLTEGNSFDKEMDTDRQYESRVIYAYKAILKLIYGLDLVVDRPIITKIFNKSQNVYNYFKLNSNTKFVRVLNLKPIIPDPTNKLKQLLKKPFNIEEWHSILPPENFLFEGVSFTRFVNITTEESIKRIQDNILYQADISDKKWLQRIQEEVQNLFRLPDLRLGVATVQRNGHLNFKSRRPIWNSLVVRSLSSEYYEKFENTFYKKLEQTHEPIVIEDLVKNEDEISSAIHKKGFRNIIWMPLLHEKDLVGILEIAHPIPDTINGLSLFKIKQIRTIFSTAIKNHQEDFENRVEAEMLTQYTAIHPTISWRFREAAIHSLDNQEDQAPIIFKNLYPFYSSLDIRDSSKKRSRAAALDLENNLVTAHQILQEAHQITSMSTLDELEYEIEQKLESLKEGFSAEDEISVARFITQDVNPILMYLQENVPKLTQQIEDYKAQLDEKTTIFSHHRKSYEKAVTRLNKCIARYLEEEEQSLQKIMPCFFKKYLTDGVEYNVYLGESLSPNRKFETLFIDDVRLRQIEWTRNIMKKVADLPDFEPLTTKSQSDLMHIEKDELEIAPLILAYGSLLTLKFNQDEKLLDVDGSYNIRYEIMKKRIDKSVILDTEDRLTQPNHISIVYSSEQEAENYRRHFKYLADRGLVQDKWEELELEPMAGVEGLKALRIQPIF